MRILITDGEQRSALAAVRSLGRAGHRVSVCSSRPAPLAGASRYAEVAFQVPDPSRDPQGFVAGVEALVNREKIDLLLPMTDVSVPLLIGLRDRHPGLTIPLPDPATYRNISDKIWLCDLARSLGVPVPGGLVLPARPTTSELEDPDTELAAMARNASFPLILKPGRSAVESAEGTARFGVRQVTTVEALHRALLEYDPAAFPLLVQERISGPGLGAFMLADRGRILATFGHCRLREKPPTGGVSVYRESVPLRSDLAEYATRIVSHVGWTGVAMVEFKEDASTGTPYLMEINGRFWGSLQLAIDAGVDFPRLLAETVSETTGGGLDIDIHPPVARIGVRSRWFWGDVDHLIGVLKAPRGYREINPELPSRLGAVLRFLVLWRPGDRYEVLDLADPRPFLRETWQWITRS